MPLPCDIKNEPSASENPAKKAKNVFLVAGSQHQVVLTIRRDGKLVGAERGKDVNATGTLEVSEERLYHLIGDPSLGEHTLEIVIVDDRPRIYNRAIRDMG